MTKDLILRFFREVWLSFIIRDVMLAERGYALIALPPVRVVLTGGRRITNPDRCVQLPQGDCGARSRC
jgi:hypothetical protein